MTEPVPDVPGKHEAPASSPSFIARARKFVVAACGMAATLLAAGVLDDKTKAIVTGLLGIATAYGVYRVPNAQRP